MNKENFDTICRLGDEATLEYHSWLKQILTLSSGSLTILVSLRNQILPEHPQSLILLQLSWFLFALSTILALFAIKGHHILLFHTQQDCIRAATDETCEQVAGIATVPKAYQIPGVIVPWVFVLAVVSLSLFGILNLN
jgi:hypothetical protein